MTFAPLLLKPGVNVEQTPLLNSAGWSQTSGIRFWQGMPQKAGGWTALNLDPLVGYTRGMAAWADLSGNPYIGCGSADLLQVYSGGAVYDITPLRATANVAVSIDTTISTPTVTITSAAHGALVGDRVVVYVPIAVGGLILFGTYLIDTVPGANTFTITAAANATATVAAGGAVPVFTTTLGGTDVTVTLAAHGLSAGAVWTVQVSTSVGGFTLSGVYTVVSVTDADNFVIQPGGAATSAASVSENGGNARYQFLIHTGAESSYYSSATGYGGGSYGAGPYGRASSAITLTALRQWFLSHFGEDLVANYNGSPLYVWAPPYSSGARALELNTTNYPSALSPPKQVQVSFVSDPQQMIVALGCDDVVSGVYDPNLVRWCDAGNFLDWYPSVTNQAGSYRIPSGSRLVGGAVAPNFTALWTDIDMWLMSYLGGQGSTGAQLVWGFQKISTGVGLLAARAVGVLQSVVYWAGPDAFYSFDGQQVREVNCPVWDKFWLNLDTTQVDKTNIQVHSSFNEVAWGFASAGGNGEVDQRVLMKIDDSGQVWWTYDDNSRWARTSWIDDNVYGQAIGTDLDLFLQQHETSYNANGAALPASVRSGWFSVEEGSIVSMMERIMADLIVTGGTQAVAVTVYAQDYPTGPVRTYGPYAWNPSSGPPYSIVRARGRWFSIEISSTVLDVFWRLGRMEHDSRPAGQRP